MTANTTSPCRILLVDDHPLLLAGVEKHIAADAGLTVCGMAGDAKSARTLVEKLLPDLIIADLTLPGGCGLEFVKDMGALHPEIPIIVLSMHDEMIYAERVLRAGGRGYIMKDAPPARLMQAIRAVLAGGVYASQKVTNSLLQSLSSGKPRGYGGFSLECLTDREMEVFQLIGQGKSNHEIADQLGISPRTLDAHRAHIREKLGFSEGSELTRHAIRWIEAGTIDR